eukprot:6211954-Pleurochrysis_carterae.AAC.1
MQRPAASGWFQDQPGCRICWVLAHAQQVLRRTPCKGFRLVLHKREAILAGVPRTSFQNLRKARSASGNPRPIRYQSVLDRYTCLLRAAYKQVVCATHSVFVETRYISLIQGQVSLLVKNLRKRVPWPSLVPGHSATATSAY